MPQSVKKFSYFCSQLNGFFRGLAFPFLASGTLNSILFGIYGNELRRMQNSCETNAERKAQWERNVFIAGSEAGFIHSFIACPIELVKIRLQTQNRKCYFVSFCFAITICMKRKYELFACYL